MREFLFWITVTVATGTAPRYGMLALEYLVRKLA